MIIKYLGAFAVSVYIQSFFMQSRLMGHFKKLLKKPDLIYIGQYISHLRQRRTGPSWLRSSVCYYFPSHGQRSPVRALGVTLISVVVAIFLSSALHQPAGIVTSEFLKKWIIEDP